MFHFWLLGCMLGYIFGYHPSFNWPWGDWRPKVLRSLGREKVPAGCLAPDVFRICDAGQRCLGFLRNDVNVGFLLLVDFQILTMKLCGKRGAETGGFYFWQLFDGKMVAQKHHQQSFTQKIRLGSRDRHPVLRGVAQGSGLHPLAKFRRQRVTHRSLMRMMFRRPHVSH